MIDRVSWGEGAVLCLRSHMPGAKPRELFHGQVVEAVQLALARPEEERPRLFISLELSDQKLTWPEIVRFSRQPDFPIII